MGIASISHFVLGDGRERGFALEGGVLWWGGGELNGRRWCWGWRRRLERGGGRWVGRQGFVGGLGRHCLIAGRAWFM